MPITGDMMSGIPFVGGSRSRQMGVMNTGPSDIPAPNDRIEAEHTYPYLNGRSRVPSMANDFLHFADAFQRQPVQRQQQQQLRNAASFQHGPWPTPRGEGTPRSMHVAAHTAPAHTGPSQRHQMPSISTVQPRFYNPAQRDINAPQLSGGRNHMLLQPNNPMPQHSAQFAGRRPAANVPASTIQQNSVTPAPGDLDKLHSRYKNLLRSYHDLSPNELQYLQRLKMLLQENGVIRNRAGNQVNRSRTAQRDFSQNQLCMPDNGSSSGVPRPTETPQLSGRSTTNSQHRENQRQQSRSNIDSMVPTVHTQPNTKRKALAEALIAPQPKRVYQISSALNSTNGSNSVVPNVKSSTSRKSAVLWNNDSPPGGVSPNVRASELIQPNQARADINPSKNVTPHKESAAPSHPTQPWEHPVLDQNRSEFYEKISDKFERAQRNRIPEVIHHPNGDRTESWTIGGSEETVVKPRGLIEHFVPPDTVLVVISKDAGNTYICPSGDRDHDNRTYMSLRAGQMGLMASYQVKAKEQEGVPLEHIKMAIFDDRVGFQGPTAGVSESGDVISLAKCRPVSDKCKSKPPSPETTSRAITPEADIQQNTTEELKNGLTADDNRNMSNPVWLSMESSDKESEIAHSDPIMCPPDVAPPTIKGIATSPLNFSPTYPMNFDPMTEEQLAPLSVEDLDRLLNGMPSPAVTKMQPQETTLNDTKAADEISSSLLQKPAVSTLPAGWATIGEYPSVAAEVIAKNNGINNKSPAMPNNLSEPTYTTALPSTDAEATTENVESVDNSSESMRGADLSKLLGEDFSQWIPWDPDQAKLS